jgi:hypothetical protein
MSILDTTVRQGRLDAFTPLGETRRLLTVSWHHVPVPWQVMLKQDNGEYACVAEDTLRYNLGQVKEELMDAMGLNMEAAGSLGAFLSSGYKVQSPAHGIQPVIEGWSLKRSFMVLSVGLGGVGVSACKACSYKVCLRPQEKPVEAARRTGLAQKRMTVSRLLGV